ncbi:MAG: RNA polymerase sigma-70 factor (ECF subfamily) [Lentimonas sp.]|jgi:RNA polymerase sigma-70 factor (ECF subfamily)
MNGLTQSTPAPSYWAQDDHVDKLMPKHTPQVPVPLNSNEEIDSICLRALAEGDHHAFTDIVERWQTRLINFFYRTTGNRSDAEDLAQETFVELYRAAAHYQARGTFKAFIFTIARRKMIDSYRKRSRRPLDYIDPTDFIMQQSPAKIDHSREIEEAFHLALSKLPDTQRMALLMRQQQELSYEEIATSLEASLSAVKSWIHRARIHLRQELKDFQ